MREVWRPPFPVDIPAVLAPLRRGRADPAWQAGEDGILWLTGNTEQGPATLAVREVSGGVHAGGWGPGGECLVAGVPALLGAGDDDSDFRPCHRVIADVRHSMPGLRLGATGRVWDVLVPAVLEQKVTGYEARRSWRELCRRYGTTAPGPGPSSLRVPPTPRALLGLADWQWHRAGVDGARRRTLIAAAQVAHRLEHACALGGSAGRELLRKVPGIGVWTAAEIAQRAWGDADAVSVGDFHIPGVVGRALAGRELDDDGMLEVLAPYVPHRHRVVRYLEAAGFSRPRFGPRHPVRDYRSM